VSILSRSLKSRSCVNFARITQAEIVCQFHPEFIRVQIRFKNSSPRWRMWRERERGSNTRKLEFLNSMSELWSTGRSTDMHREGKPHLAVNRLIDRPYSVRVGTWIGRSTLPVSSEVCTVNRAVDRILEAVDRPVDRLSGHS